MKLKFLTLLLFGAFILSCTPTALDEDNGPLQEETNPIPPIPPSPSPCIDCI